MKLRKMNAHLDKELALIRLEKKRNAQIENYLTFAIAAGFSVIGYAISFITAAPAGADKTLSLVWVVIGLVIAGGALYMQIKLRASDQ